MNSYKELCILYLGLDPARFAHRGRLIHYPVIRIEVRSKEDREVQEALRRWPECTDVLFTSRSAVFAWRELVGDWRGKRAIAVGTATAEAAGEALIAKEACQEGVIALLASLDFRGRRLFWPRSSQARPKLEGFLRERAISYAALDLYRTMPQRPEPVPDLAEVDEIVFTSPSCVEGFLQIFGAIPENKKILVIGEVTKRFLNELKIC